MLQSMMWSELSLEWATLVNAQKSCRRCVDECDPSLIQAGARPLFGRFKVWKNGALFLFAAPNRDDTFDEDKGYLTYDREIDLSGRFARQLMVEELKLDPDYFQVTNFVLCLPAEKGGLKAGRRARVAISRTVRMSGSRAFVRNRK